MFVPREIAPSILASSQEYPVICVTGPRQSGKTTLCKALFPEKPYCSLENPTTLLRVSSDPEGFLSGLPSGAVVDEAQRFPPLLSYLQGMVDAEGVPGRFVLTGSSNLLLMEKVSQTLAGRCAPFTLLPFSLEEAMELRSPGEVFSAILSGGYPRLLSQKLRRGAFFANYIATYVERDVRQLLNIKDTLQFSRFLKLLAGRIGSLLDYTSLANDCGISVPTVREWLSILEASYICFQLPPWHENRGKRLVKSPKLYFYDTGIACALLQIGTTEQLLRDPLRGGLFENLMIVEKLKAGLNRGERPELYFYRDSNGVEVDLVEHREGRLLPTEIKSSMTFHPDFCRSLQTFAERYSDICGRPTVQYAGSESFPFKGCEIRGFP